MVAFADGLQIVKELCLHGPGVNPGLSVGDCLMIFLLMVRALYFASGCMVNRFL